MRWLIRRVVKKGKGSVSYEEDIHYGDVLTIGRGSDQAIFLPDLRVALEHAKVTFIGGGQYKVESLILAGIRVNNEITHATTVGPGAMIEIGATRVQLLEPPVDYDAGVEISALDKTEEKALKAAKALPTSLSQTWISKRKPAWILFLLIAAFFFVLPLMTHFSYGWSQILRKSPLPSQQTWSAGPLAPAHQAFGSDCKQCHEKAFVQVLDSACARCHGNTKAHADPAKFNLPELGEARCKSCHQDHLGQLGLVRKDQELCSDCHRNLKDHTKGASTLIDVADFGAVKKSPHPEFQVDMPAWDADGKFTPVRTRLAPGLKETSGLIYPHDKHLRAEGLKTPDGVKYLTCANCHTLEPGGARFKPVNFETMCQSCHRLDFDVLAPDRQVPHGKVSEIIFMLDEFYGERALEGGYQDATAPFIVQQRRRPGEPMSQQQTQEALAWARTKARQVGETLFTTKACKTCHTIERGTTPAKPWIVAPVRVAGEWYPRSHFNHDSHQTNITEARKELCEDCHAAKASKASSDLLIPGIDNCRQCHGGEKVKDKIASTCIECHGYHQSKFLVLTELQARAAKKP